MREQLQHLPKPVAATILSYYRRRQFYALLRALLVPVLCYGVLALIGTHVDRFLFLDTGARVLVSWLVHGLSLVVAAVAVGVFAWRRLSVRSVAYELERLLPRSAAERLVTLDDVMGRAPDARTGDSGCRVALVDQLADETVRLCEETPNAGRLARDRRLNRRTRFMVFLGLAWVGLFVVPAYQFPLMLERLTFPNRNLPKPSFMRLVVTPEAPVVGRGEEVVLQVQVTGEIPRLLQQPMRWLGVDSSVSLLATATGKVDRLAVAGNARPMSRVQRRLFVSTLSDLQNSLSYRIRCGDAQTDLRYIQVVAQPLATNVCVQVQPPAYTGLETVRVTDLRDPIPAFAGSRVEVRFGTDQAPLKSARMVKVQNGETLADLNPDAKTGGYLYAFEMANPVDMEVVIVNSQGFENVERVRISLALREDQPPAARLEYPVGHLTVSEGDLVPMHMELSDDLGLQDAAICYQINPGRNSEAAAREIPLAIPAKVLTHVQSSSFDLEKIGALSGDEIVLWVRVRDTANRDERSQGVSISVTAFAGNENERRRLQAMRLVAQALLGVEAVPDRGVLALKDEAYESLLTAAKAQNLELNSQPCPESLLEFVEREHHFTDSAEAAWEARMLHGVILGLLQPSPALLARPGTSLDTRKAAVRKLAEVTLPALLCERMGRDLVRRALNLRNATASLVGVTGEGGDGDGSDSQRQKMKAVAARSESGSGVEQAALGRRIDLVLGAVDSTGADLAALARLSSLIKVEDVLACTRQISRAGYDLKNAGNASRQEVAGKALCEQIEGWVRLLLPVLPEWSEQRRAARAVLRKEYEEYRRLVDAAWRSAPEKASALDIRWIAADARMAERSPFVGLGERIRVAVPAEVDVSWVATNQAMNCEAAVLSRMGIESEFASWLASARVTRSERKLAAAFQALDLAGDDAARTSAVERLKGLSLDDSPGPDVRSGPMPVGLSAGLAVLTGAATNIPPSHDRALDALAERTANLQQVLGQMLPSGEDGSVPNPSAHLPVLEAGLAQWEADAMRLACRMHLDLAYGDPRRESIAPLSALLPALRGVIGRYQAFVPPLIVQIRSRAGRSSGPEGAAAIRGLMDDLGRRIGAMETGLKNAAKQFRSGKVEGQESGAVRKARLYYLAARKLAESENPGAVAEAFFVEQPGAAALVLDERVGMLGGVLEQVKEAEQLVRAESGVSAGFVETMGKVAGSVDEFARLLGRFATLDADGAVRALASDVSSRAQALSKPGREGGADRLSRDKLALSELRRQVEQLEKRTRELISRSESGLPSGWWGGPAGIWDGASRRDAEHARSRLMAQFKRAQRETALGFEVVLMNRDKVTPAMRDAPLAGALFAWRTLHSSLGGDTVVRRVEQTGGELSDPLMRWLMSELEETEKNVKRSDSAHRYKKQTDEWVDSVKGYLRH